MASSTGTIPKKYPKRSGTSGIRGHLYETKLLSLIYFRAIHNDRIEEFHLATNVDKLGSFDDICFRAKVKGIDRPLTVFIQAKHRENNAISALNLKSDLATYFNSYLEIQRKFKPKSGNVLFDGTFCETECLFVIYTTAKVDHLTTKYEGIFCEHLNALLRTGEPDSQPIHGYISEELYEIVLEEQMTALARPMAKCIFGEFNDIQMLMQDEHVLRYHVILAQKAFDVSENQTGGHRVARLKQDFFHINERFLRLFKEELWTEIFKRRKLNSVIMDRLLHEFGLAVCDVLDSENVNKQVACNVTYKNRKFEFLDKTISDHHKLLLDKINESKETIQKTIELAVKEYLPSLEFKVPTSFGNKDLTIKGGDQKIERKLKDLSSKIVALIKQAGPDNIVLIDESMGTGFLQLSGGIASAVGNLLVYDDISKLMKFNDNFESLGKLAKKLFDRLNSEIKNLYEYKFNIKVKIFPKLSFTTDEYTKNILSDFSKMLVFYTSQSNEDRVETTLIYEINNSLSDDIQNGEITSDAIFLKYHDEIQKWWMEPKAGEYLTKEGSKYEKAVKQTSTQPLINVLNMMQKIINKNNTFSEDAENSIKLECMPTGTVIVTDNSVLTIAKLTRYLINKDCVVLDLKYIFNLSARDDKTLRRELTNTDAVKTVIVVFDKSLITTISSNKLENIANSIKNRKVIIITDLNSIEIARKYFSIKDNVVKDERNNLIDMSEESQKNILQNSKVTFQDEELTLDQLLDDKSIRYVGGAVLYKIMYCDKNTIGGPVSHLNYEQNLFYQKQKIYYNSDPTTDLVESDEENEERVYDDITSVHDVENDVLLILADGEDAVGESKLLTSVSLKTKKQDPTIWILRINLFQHSRQFLKWQKARFTSLPPVLRTVEILKFLCQVALSEESSKKEDVQIMLETSNDTILLKECTGDVWTVFELQMFLHYYNNTNKLVILFDGFDKICPNYAPEVWYIIHLIKNHPQKHKIWITSRSNGRQEMIRESFTRLCSGQVPL